ncbi:hypothetical protein HDU84_004515 [Entophlyctis sp. JEL0112]|nr:hypothetical protein HDU84_004515 [Entophlyctis sp. JEL0112]
MSLVTDLHRASQLLVAGDSLSARTILLHILSACPPFSRDDDDPKTTRIRVAASVMLLRTIDAANDNAFPTSTWNVVCAGWPEGLQAVPVTVALAGVLMFARANNTYEAQELFESWMCTQSSEFLSQVSNHAEPAFSAYANLVQSYITHVLAKKSDFAAATEFLDMNELLTDAKKKELRLIIKDLQDTSHSKDSSLATEPEVFEDPGNAGNPNLLNDVSVAPKKAVEKIPILPSSSVKAVALSSHLAVSELSKCSEAKAVKVREVKDPKITVKAVLLALKKNIRAILSATGLLAVILAFKYRKSSTMESFSMMLKRFLRTLSMASSL